MSGRMTVQQQLESGMSHHQAGRLAEAEAIYRQILSWNPNHAEALHLLGLIAGQHGNDDQAIDLIGRAIRLKPDLAAAQGPARRGRRLLPACGQAQARFFRRSLQPGRGPEEPGTT
jgi:tetratricopeptide (TPR) repeat protein